MDRAARNLLALAAVAIVVAAYGFCGLVAYGVLPLLEGNGRVDGVGLLGAVVLGMLLAVALARGGLALRRQASATRELSGRIEQEAVEPPPRLVLAAAESGLAGQISLLDAAEPCSFVYGALAPRVAISTGLLWRLSPDELRAALEHERYHVQNFDPLRGAIACAVVDALFFLPALGILRGRYEEARELAADRRAMRTAGVAALAGALLRASEGEESRHPAMVPLAARRRIDSRLAQLESGREPGLGGIDRRCLLATLIGVLAFLTLLVGVSAAGGDLGGTLASEFSPASLLEGVAFCLGPVALGAALASRIVSSRSSRTA